MARVHRITAVLVHPGAVYCTMLREMDGPILNLAILRSSSPEIGTDRLGKVAEFEIFSGLSGQNPIVMTARRGLGIVLVYGATFASIGGIIGALLGTVAPGYYRSMFRGGHAPDFHPTQVGVGLGVTQGLALRVVTALGVAGIS